MERTRLAAAVALCVLAAGCVSQVDGAAQSDPGYMPRLTSKPGKNPLESATPSTQTKTPQKLCTLLTAADLPYKAPATNPVAETNVEAEFDQSCRWSFEVPDQNLKVGVQLAYRPKTRNLAVENPSGAYTIANRRVEFFQEADPICTLAMKYSDGNVGIHVVDASNLFGPQCEIGRTVAKLLLSREPPTLS